LTDWESMIAAVGSGSRPAVMRQARRSSSCDRDPKPVWLWFSRTGTTSGEVDRLWQAFLRRFDLEHTFRLFGQVLGWTAPKIRDPAAADRWTWLIITCHAQLRLARPLAADLRHPWERPAPPGRLTPARVRRGFRNIRAKGPCPAGAPKPGRPGPGRPPGSKNRRPAPRHDVGKPADGNAPSRQNANAQVKRQAKGRPCRQADGRHVIDSALRATLMIQAKDTESDQAPHGGYRAARRSDGSIKAEA
jgi:hypothetical protein